MTSRAEYYLVEMKKYANLLRENRKAERDDNALRGEVIPSTTSRITKVTPLEDKESKFEEVKKFPCSKHNKMTTVLSGPIEGVKKNGGHKSVIFIKAVRSIHSTGRSAL